MARKKSTVFVAMSGGVDSSVAAALLKQMGFSVVGVYMKCWEREEHFSKGCTSLDDERSARLAAGHLNIPLYIWNFVKEYREHVVEYLLEGYRRGVTPNPDIMCNREIKFGLFFDRAMALGAEYMATGHYARIDKRGGTCRVLAGKDREKDQSYFLAFLKPEVLAHVLFPVGEYTKSQIRELARALGLPNASRPSSRGICFIGKIDFEKFLRQRIPQEKGEMIDMTGKMLGTHEGLAYYTIGQRKGIGLSGGPYYVVGKDFASNRLVLSRDEKDLYTSRVLLGDTRWFRNVDAFPFAREVEAKIRYRQNSSPVALRPLPGKADMVELMFHKPQRAAAPGQFAALYEKEELVGAGVIQ